ncbi:MAG TPA: hypothetical protein VHD60_02530 [Candidatus Saccharimonadales bacterium]|nr:hypothetical protein [Candidatus Saccharimonadales bacterium]
MTKRLRRRIYIYGTTLAILAMLATAAYIFAVRPNDEANRYNQQLTDSAVILHATLTSLSRTIQLNIFNTPDGTLTSRLHDLDSITRSITATRSQLARFETQANDLHTMAHLPIFNSYHNAQISQQNARDIVSQTSDALDQYQKLANFLRQYYTLDNTFTTITGKINAVSNLDSLIPDYSQVYADSQTLDDLATSVRKLAAPAAYVSLVSTATSVYQQAAQGLHALANGLSLNNDATKNSGIAMVEQATAQHDDKLIDIPFNDVQNSYVLTQISELPDKTDSILSAHTSGD